MDSVVLWFNTVLPSLFPFLVAVGILLRLGAAQKMGRLLQCCMQPLFGCRGVCAFPWVLGLLSGYPMGAKMTAILYENGEISKAEACHLLSFANNPGPLFVIGTVGTAFFQNPVLGYGMLAAVWLSSVVTGILLRPIFHNAHDRSATALAKPIVSEKKDILSRSIADAMETCTQIGGYIILFGVVTEAFSLWQITELTARLLGFLPISAKYVQGVIGGILEMTNGSYLLSQTEDPLLLRLCSATFLVTFGGCSILGQSRSVSACVPLRLNACILTKLLQGSLAAGFMALSFPFWAEKAKKAVTVFSMNTETAFSSFSILPISIALLLFALLGLLFAAKQ